jgi:hypothetical protein
VGRRAVEVELPPGDTSIVVADDQRDIAVSLGADLTKLKFKASGGIGFGLGDDVTERRKIAADSRLIRQADEGYVSARRRKLV